MKIKTSVISHCGNAEHVSIDCRMKCTGCLCIHTLLTYTNICHSYEFCKLPSSSSKQGLFLFSPLNRIYCPNTVQRECINFLLHFTEENLFSIKGVFSVTMIAIYVSWLKVHLTCDSLNHSTFVCVHTYTCLYFETVAVY